MRKEEEEEGNDDKKIASLKAKIQHLKSTKNDIYIKINNLQQDMKKNNIGTSYGNWGNW